MPEIKDTIDKDFEKLYGLLKQMKKPYDDIYDEQQELAVKKYNKKRQSRNKLLEFLNPSEPLAVITSTFGALGIDNQMGIISRDIQLYKIPDNGFDDYNMIIKSVKKLDRLLKKYIKKEPKVKVNKFQKLVVNLLKSTTELKDKYIVISYDDAVKEIDKAFINKKRDIVLAINSYIISENLPPSVSLEDMRILISNDLKKQINNDIYDLSIQKKLTKKELDAQLGKFFKQKLKEIPAKIVKMLASVDNSIRADVEKIVTAAVT